MNVYLDEKSPDAFTDFPELLRQPDHMKDSHECPRCQRHGGWNLKLKAYPLHGLADTPENRHRFSHFRANCPQCNGYGWTNEDCLHDWEPAGSIAMHQPKVRCTRCGQERVYDSSG